MSTRTIGTNGLGYTQNRNFAHAPLQKYTFAKSFDIFSTAKVLYRKTVGRPPQNLRIWHSSLGLSKRELHHFFNTISFDKTPWISTFGWLLPRKNGEWRKRIGIPQLAKPECKRLIATSSCARNAEIAMLQDFPAQVDTIVPKICVLHPPQSLLTQSYDDKQTPAGRIECTFVGNAFYRKGGRETLLAFDRLWARGYPLYLNIVSNFSFVGKGTKYHRDDETIGEVQRLIERNRQNISLFSSIPNEAVVELFRQSHIGLLPTYFDAYGYSALETLATGCALITTNVMALGEVNDDSCGWVVDVPCDDLRHPKLSNTDEIAHFSSVLEQGIERALIDAAEDPVSLRQKGERALIRIRERHDPDDHARALEAIYDEILGV